MGASPAPPARAAAVAGALILALWRTAGRGPQIALSEIVGALMVSLLALLGIETSMIVLNSDDDRDARGWFAAFVLAIMVSGALAVLA